MEFIRQLLFNSIEFVVLCVVMVAGVIVGKKLRDRKDAKPQDSEEKQ